MKKAKCIETSKPIPVCSLQADLVTTAGGGGGGIEGGRGGERK